MGVDEEQSLQRKVETPDELLARVSDAAARIEKREDQHGRTTRDLRTRVRECTEVAVGNFERSLWTATDLSFLCNKSVVLTLN